MVIDDNRNVIRRLYEEAINPGQLSLLDELIAAEFQGADGETGSKGFRRPLDELRRGFPDIHFAVEDLIIEGDRVAVRWTWQGTHTGQFREFAPTGLRITDTGMAFYELRAGKVARVWMLTDRLGFLEQVGVVPRSPSGPPAPGKDRSRDRTPAA
jgi:predicted ester cyclase